MQPTEPNGQRADGFRPKYRHFHPLDRVWVQNPFEHDVVYQVADEYNQPFTYRLPKGRVSELPGGAIATLGVKRIVDELIQNNGDTEVALMWDTNTRSKHEANIILRIKNTTPGTNPATPGEVDLSVKSDKDVPATEEEPVVEPEQAFPGLGKGAQKDTSVLDPLPSQVAAGIDSVVGASLPSSNSVVSANNAHPNVEG